MNRLFFGTLAGLASAVALADTDVAANAFLRENLRAITDEVTMYRPALQAMTGDPRVGRDARESLQRIDALMTESARFAGQTRLDEAVKRGEAAKRLAIQAMVKLKSGQTVTHALKFETPADEYAYELRRFESNEMLVGMNLQESTDAGVRQRVSGELDTAKRLRQSAAGDAAAGRHAEAVKQMETAAVHLNRALQALGVPVF
ncbi:MAG: hypothetical protein RKP46_13220 [Candidatus Accumulibacter sp.]|uniref:hypothetical protein n=1 Tax=Accumulibacter sp. TaxID=2053492 RepID=UPI00287B5AEF|nr:hypothetical protein [Accumulibacter sp.]MDS4015287.1 hypothetical protein [Accumulibacter sp.]